MNSENRVRVLKIFSSRTTAPANIIFTQELEYIVNTILKTVNSMTLGHILGSQRKYSIVNI